MSNFKCRRILSIFMACALCIAVAVFPANAKTDAEFEDEINRLENQIAAENDKKEQSQQTADDLMDQIELMQEQLDVYNEKINELNKQIADKDAVIAQYQAEIDGLQADIDAADQKQTELETEISGTYDLLSERLYAAYVAGETSTLEILLSAEDFETFLTRLELVKRISEHDTALVADLQADINELNTIKEKLDRDQAAVEEKQASVQSERDAVASVRAEQQSAYNTLKTKQSTLDQKVLKLNTYMAQLDSNTDNLQAKLDRAMAEYDAQKSQGMSSGSGTITIPPSGSPSEYPVSSKGMICPLQYPNVVISAGWYGYANHQGIDFTTAGATGNTYGKAIVAAADGVVYSAEYHYSWGNNVYIDHGNGVYTRYAHCSSMVVSKGQTVKQGQVIAYVGNTGNVSPKPTASNPHAGAHLHFEVWVNGKRVNPAPWLP